MVLLFFFFLLGRKGNEELVRFGSTLTYHTYGTKGIGEEVKDLRRGVACLGLLVCTCDGTILQFWSSLLPCCPVRPTSLLSPIVWECPLLISYIQVQACLPGASPKQRDAYSARIALCFNAYYNIYVDNATLHAMQVSCV